MRFTLQYPIAHPGYSPALRTADGIRQVAAAAEAAGFDCIAFTEHPVPSTKWQDHGGHDSFDPLTALAVCAGVTTTIKLQSYVLVLPYRNPFLAAKQVATVDVISGGRLILGLGVGYLRSEFLALGVEFDERNELFDEGLAMMRAIWRDDSVVHVGRHFEARGQTARPFPTSRSGPPVWIGGNSTAARERVARGADGWCPLLIGPEAAATTRTSAMPGVDDLRRGIDDLHHRAAAHGRAGVSFDVQIEWRASSDPSAPADQCLARIDELQRAGATWMVIDPPGDDVAHTVEIIHRYGADVIAASR